MLVFNGFRAWKTERETGKGGILKMAVETRETETERGTNGFFVGRRGIKW